MGGSLHLATMWNFDQIREGVITQMDKMISNTDAFERIDTSLKCRVEKWLHPAYEALCTRSETLSDSEAERLGLRRAAAIWRIRERLLSDRAPSVSYGSPAVVRTGPPSGGLFGHVTTHYERRDPPPSNNNGRKNVLAMIENEESLKFPS
ncbi:hypothetical protein FS837_012202 [Tulasnella sp. UAMH 9824]|nr:hypothetical protein FS837_012202 [Tulasnella sp. UAMH 9824]